MAFSPFTAGLFTAGQILTAAQMNTYIRDNIMAGGPVYATEAARNADIPSPFEGQRAYITGSTVAAATGAVTAVPTGIQTIYNGAGWVCVTPVGAYSNTAATSTSTSYVTTLTGDATAVSVTLTTGTTAFVNINATAYNNSAGTGTQLSFAVSGATTIAAADANGATFSQDAAGYQFGLQRAYVFTGLTAGTNTFTLAYKTSGSTMGWNYRNLTVQGVA